MKVTAAAAAVLAAMSTAGAMSDQYISSNITRTYQSADLSSRYGILDMAQSDIFTLEFPADVSSVYYSVQEKVTANISGNTVIVACLADTGTMPFVVILQDGRKQYFMLKFNKNKTATIRNIKVIDKSVPDNNVAEPVDPIGTEAPTSTAPTPAEPVAIRATHLNTDVPPLPVSTVPVIAATPAQVPAPAPITLAQAAPVAVTPAPKKAAPVTAVAATPPKAAPVAVTPAAPKAAPVTAVTTPPKAAPVAAVITAPPKAAPVAVTPAAPKAAPVTAVTTPPKKAAPVAVTPAPQKAPPVPAVAALPKEAAPVAAESGQQANVSPAVMAARALKANPERATETGRHAALTASVAATPSAAAIRAVQQDRMDQRVAQINREAVTAPAPVAAAPAPVAAAPAPVATTPAPVAATPAPVAATPAPVVANTRPFSAQTGVSAKPIEAQFISMFDGGTKTYLLYYRVFNNSAAPYTLNEANLRIRIAHDPVSTTGERRSQLIQPGTVGFGVVQIRDDRLHSQQAMTVEWLVAQESLGTMQILKALTVMKPAMPLEWASTRLAAVTRATKTPLMSKSWIAPL